MATKTRTKTLFVVTVDAGCNTAMAYVYVVRAGKPTRVQCTMRSNSAGPPPYDRAATAVVEYYLDGKAPRTPIIHRVDLGRVPGANDHEVAIETILTGIKNGRWI